MMVLVTDLDNGFFHVECDGERHHVSLADLPDLLMRLGVEPRQWDDARRPLTPRENDILILILTGLWRGLDRDVSRRVAARWIAAHLVPSTRPNRLGIDYWRSVVEHETGRYVPRSVMAAALAERGVKVQGDRIHAREVKPSHVRSGADPRSNKVRRKRATGRSTP
jgi:hypothetical protein